MSLQNSPTTDRDFTDGADSGEIKLGTPEKEHATKADIKSPVEEVSNFDKPIPIYVMVSRNKSAQYYADRIRRVLRTEESCSLRGRGNAVEMACRVSELLKQQNVAIETKVSTSLNVEPFFNARGDARWDEPAIMICIELARGDLALCVMGYTQRRVIDIFEQNDAEMKGYVSVQTVEQLSLAKHCFANEGQVSAASALLNRLKDDNDNLNLPNFIRYASALIHPLLKQQVLAKVFKDEFGITDDDDVYYHMANEDESIVS